MISGQMKGLVLIIQAVIYDKREGSLGLINYARVTFIRSEQNYLASHLTRMNVSAMS